MEQEFEKRGDLNPHAEMYGERLREHLSVGCLGYIIGFVLCLAAMIIMYFETDGLGEALGTMSYAVISLLASFVVGFIFAGVPYGWTLINRLLGGWFISGSLFVVIFAYFTKFALAMGIGMFAYPVMLAVYFVRSRKTKNRVRFWAVIIIGAVVLFYIFVGVFSFVNAKSNAAEASETESAVVQVDIDSFDDQDVLLKKICENAVSATKEEETEHVTSYGWEVSEGSQLHGVFFMEASDPNDLHYINRRLSLSNAVAVVTGYYLVEAGPCTINQWEMDVTIYPNFSFDDDQVLTYDLENVYTQALRADDMEYLLDWLFGEYHDMAISEIDYP